MMFKSLLLGRVIPFWLHNWKRLRRNSPTSLCLLRRMTMNSRI
ncbi:glycogen/starch synthase, ADP-glucose type family protein, partial [Vibrio parahaemolyticus AQ3810]